MTSFTSTSRLWSESMRTSGDTRRSSRRTTSSEVHGDRAGSYRKSAQPIAPTSQLAANSANMIFAGNAKLRIDDSE